jgi:hypothetical protein
MSQHFIKATLQHHTITTSQHYNVTILQCHNFTMSHRHKLTRTSPGVSVAPVVVIAAASLNVTPLAALPAQQQQEQKL